MDEQRSVRDAAALADNHHIAGERFVAEIGAFASEDERLRTGLPQLHALFRDLIRAAVPPNPQFERERIIADAPNPRELVFLLGLLSEGENEAALLLELAAAVLRDEPGAPIAHIIDEAWYYLRTSIDDGWQLDDGRPCASAALAYLYAISSERLAELRRAELAPGLAARARPDRERLLRALRERFMLVGDRR